MTDERRPTNVSGTRGVPRGSRFFSSVDASMLGLGSQMLSEVVAGVLLGYGLDYLLGTRNRWVVVGSIAGVAVAMVSVVRVAMRPQTPRRRPPGERETPGADVDRTAAGQDDAPGGSPDAGSEERTR